MMRWESPEEVGRLLFSPSGRLLATTRCCGDDEGQDVLRLWDPIAGLQLAHVEGLNPAFALAFAAERELVVVEEHRCLLWGPDAAEARVLWEGHTAPTWKGPRRFTAGTASPDGKALVLGLESTIVIIDLPSGEVRHRLRTPKETEVWYDDVAVAGGRLAAVCRAERNVFTFVVLWDLQRGKKLRTYDVSDAGEVHLLALRPDGAGLAVHDGRRLYVFEMETEDESDGFRKFKCDKLRGLRYSPGCRELWALCGDRLFRLGAATGEVLGKVKVPTGFQWPQAAIDPAGCKVALAEGPAVEVWDLLDGRG
jgi:hypothetical protein